MRFRVAWNIGPRQKMLRQRQLVLKRQTDAAKSFGVGLPSAMERWCLRVEMVFPNEITQVNHGMEKDAGKNIQKSNQ